MKPFDLRSLEREYRVVKTQEYATESREERLWHLAIPGRWGDVTPYSETRLMAALYKHKEAIRPELRFWSFQSRGGPIIQGKRRELALQIEGATLISESDEDVLISFPPEALPGMAGILGLKRKRKATPAQLRALAQRTNARSVLPAGSSFARIKEVASA